MSASPSPSSQRSLFLRVTMAACVVGMLGGCAHGVPVPSDPLAQGEEAEPLILEYRSDASIRRIYNAGDLLEIESASDPHVPDLVRFGTYDAMTGVLHLSGADGQWLPPVPITEVTSIARRTRADLSVPVAVVIGVGSGAVVGGWFWYNTLEYLRYEGENLNLYTAVLTTMTSAIGGLAIAYLFGRTDRVLDSGLGSKGQWVVLGETAQVSEKPGPSPPLPAAPALAAPAPQDDGGDGASPASIDATDPPLAVDPVERWRALKDRLVDVEIEGVWKRYRVGTAQPEGVQLKWVRALRGRVVPYGSITGVR